MKYRLLILLSLCLVLSGCTAQTGMPSSSYLPQETAPAQMDLPADGFVSCFDVLSGGTEMTGINLRQVDVSLTQDGDTQISLTFVDGSELMGIEEAAPLDVPTYSTDWFEGADRLVLHLQGVSFWDYLLTPPDVSGTVIQDLFYTASDVQEGSELILQISETVDYALTCENNRMTILLRPVGEEQNNVYCVAVSGYERYYAAGSAAQLREMGFAPSLCSDGTASILLSVPFEDESLALNYLEDVRTELTSLLPGLVPEITSFASNRLPEYNAESALNLLSQTAVVSRDGESVISPVLLSDGTYLCRIPDGSGYFYTRSLPQALDQEFPYYELICSRNGKDAPLLEQFEFMSVISAQCSMDSAYIAVAEQTTAVNLSVIDIQSGEVFLPAEEGLWSDLISYCWHQKDPILYCLTCDEQGDIRIYAYDLRDPSHPSVATVGEGYWNDAELFFAQGRILSLQYDEEMNRRVCAIDPQDGSVLYYQSADSLTVDPTGTHYAAITMIDSETSHVVIADAAAGNTVCEFDTASWIDMAWDVTGDRLYAATMEPDASWEDEFPLTLSQVDVKTGSVTSWMNAKVGALYTSHTSGEVWMLYIFTYQGQVQPITFIIR